VTVTLLKATPFCNNPHFNNKRDKFQLTYNCINDNFAETLKFKMNTLKQQEQTVV